MKSAKPMRVVIYASDLAACIGRNRYSSRDDMKMLYLKRTCPTAYATMAEETGKVCSHDATTAALGRLCALDASAYACATSSVEHRVAAVVERPDYATEVHSATRDAVSAVDMHADALGPHDAALLRGHVQRRANTTLGICGEALVAKSAAPRAIKDDVFHKRSLGSVDGPETVEVFVGGKCDGFDNEARAIVEIKNRTRRLFQRVVDYERVQIMAYMFIYGVRRATLVERFQGDVASHDVAWDEADWAGIVHDAHAFAAEVAALARQYQRPTASATCVGGSI